MIIELPVYIETTRTHGKSYLAFQAIRKNSLVFIVTGPIVKTPTIYTIPVSHELFIDPMEYSGKYLCHSCDPNCGIKQRTEIVAMRDIQYGEEITIDYAMIVSRYGEEMTEENRVCRCGSPCCREKLGTFEDLSPALKKKYEGFISEYLFEA